MAYKFKFALLLLLIIKSNGYSQIRITADISTIHTVGGIHEFDRSKYINIHSYLLDHEFYQDTQLFNYVLNDLDVYTGRDNGMLPFIMRYSEQDSKNEGYIDSKYISKFRKNYNNDYWKPLSEVIEKYEYKENLILGGQVHSMWPGKMTTPYFEDGKSWTFKNGDAAGDFIGSVLNEFYREPNQNTTKRVAFPKYIEILNEPYYHLVTNDSSTPREIFEYHNAVATAIRKHNTNIMIGGYTTAFPDFDENNFQNWHERMKLFYDISGENMDFISIHMYDFNNHHYNNGASFHGPIYFKGSRAEATLDLLEQYSYLKWNKVKPILISEFCGRDHLTEWREWTPERDWNIMKSMSSLMLEFMDRPDNILKAIPFIVPKALWADDGDKYAWRLMRQNESGQWVYTELVKFYQLWSNVKGTRVYSQSDNVDILTDAYVDGNKLYLIVSNLNFIPQLLNFEVPLNNNKIETIEIKHLFLKESLPQLVCEKTDTEQLKQFVIGKEATAILEYTFSDTVKFENDVLESKYYADSYLEQIDSGANINFAFNNIHTENVSSAVLRLSIGRGHKLSKQPVISFNGKNLSVPDNYSGDNQRMREAFFGMLEVDVPKNILMENNNVSVQFPDSGGYVSSVTLQVFELNQMISE